MMTKRIMPALLALLLFNLTFVAGAASAGVLTKIYDTFVSSPSGTVRAFAEQINEKSFDFSKLIVEKPKNLLLAALLNPEIKEYAEKNKELKSIFQVFTDHFGDITKVSFTEEISRSIFFANTAEVKITEKGSDFSWHFSLVEEKDGWKIKKIKEFGFYDL
ncbi:MAG: hypothetical protein LBO03_10110 [Acidaminococcales bacterium]|jgi:hypothetical protein|nr:hypothetical protein [Acidaminococcales bacterium]